MADQAVTGDGQAHDKDASARAGFDAHLTKPADSTALAKLLRQTWAGSYRSQNEHHISVTPRGAATATEGHRRVRAQVKARTV